MALLDIFKKRKSEVSTALPAAAVKAKPTKTAAGQLTKIENKKSQPVKDSAKSGKKSVKKRTTTGLAYRVLLRPMVTEKATYLSEQQKYIFSVHPQSTKAEIKQAVALVYNVTPVKINVCHFAGKGVRYGRSFGRTKSWKKAIVTLKAGEKIEVFEGV